MTMLHIVIFVSFVTSFSCTIAFNVAWHLDDFIANKRKGVNNG